jgi:protein-L-isoaspartate(D-aspartate) O-methyltransferase
MTSDRVSAAFAAVPREGFLPEDQVRFADQDRALPIGHGQTNSQPTTVRNMLDLLDVREGQRVLDVGCGSGWTTGLLGHLVGPRGAVVGVEIVPELVDFGQANLSRLDQPWASIRQAAPDVVGIPEQAPFDRVLVSAAATRLPAELVDQLAVDGLMVVPVSGVMTEVRRTDSGAETRRHGAYSFVPLIEPGS